jgi:hypothetical protein
MDFVVKSDLEKKMCKEKSFQQGQTSIQIQSYFATDG